MTLRFRWPVLAACLALAACASTAPPTGVAPVVPLAWQAPLPHNGTLTDLSQWWQQQGDPLLVALIDAAQRVSPGVSSARARMAQARATLVGARASLGPTLDASASASRAPSQTGSGLAGGVAGGAGGTGGVGAGGLAAQSPPATTLQAGLQAAWEIDLFGGNRANQDAAQARLDGAEAQWHDARVLVAAEVANQYLVLRSCQRLLAVSEADAASRAETARLTELGMEAGFIAPANVALARASAADARSRATQQRGQCDVALKALVALTGLSEPDLKSKVDQASMKSDDFAPVFIASVPVQAISQRPDVFGAEREVVAASREVGFAQAQRLPRLSLNGSIGVVGYRVAGVSVNADTWSIGPISLSVPLFDGGRAVANVAAAQARYDDAVLQYQGKVRQAVREVEEALVNLQSTDARSTDAAAASEGYRAAFTATEARYRAGLASLVELEDARRTALAADTNRLALQRERAAAWVALYRAVGGGWQAPGPLAAAPR